jgi:hypothetical protein
MAEKRNVKEPFPGAYWLGLIITVALLILMVYLGTTLGPGPSGFIVAFALGLTVSRRYAPWFLAAGIFSAILGFLGHDPQPAWGGVGLTLASFVAWRWIRI